MGRVEDLKDEYGVRDLDVYASDTALFNAGVSVWFVPGEHKR